MTFLKSLSYYLRETRYDCRFQNLREWSFFSHTSQHRDRKWWEQLRKEHTWAKSGCIRLLNRNSVSSPWVECFICINSIFRLVLPPCYNCAVLSPPLSHQLLFSISMINSRLIGGEAGKLYLSFTPKVEMPVLSGVIRQSWFSFPRLLSWDKSEFCSYFGASWMN